MATPANSPRPQPAPTPRPSSPKQRRGDGPASPGVPKRKRGGQPGNLNARKSGTFSAHRPGPLSPIRTQVKALAQLHNSGALPPEQITGEARALTGRLFPMLGAARHDPLTIIKLTVQLVRMISSIAASSIPAVLLERALSEIALDPFCFFKRTFKDSGITRDADSFFFVSKFSARNTPLPPAHPSLATNLTDEQWAVLAPLIPPDPRADWLSGQHPVIIAANRWGFSDYSPGSVFTDFEILQDHDRILQRHPALATPPPPSSRHPKRGRPPNLPASPRALLDAIFWKLATGHTWSELPGGFPPARVCRKYYRRLFLSGRLYTLLLALYNHLRLEGGVYLWELMEAGVFTTTAGQKIALAPGVPATWQNYTALLFMQLARGVYSRLQAEWKREHPLHLPLPSSKGDDALSTGELPAPRPAAIPLVFEPLETSLAAKKWRKIERDRKMVAREHVQAGA